MKKILLFITLVIGIIASPGYAHAANVLDPACQGVPDATLCKDNTAQDVGTNRIYGPNGILTKVASILSIIVGVVCIIAIIIAGLRYILSGGDSQQAASAKNAILYAIVGLVVAVSARVILSFVIGRI